MVGKSSVNRRHNSAGDLEPPCSRGITKMEGWQQKWS